METSIRRVCYWASAVTPTLWTSLATAECARRSLCVGMTSRLLGRALRGALTRCRPSTPQLLSSRLAVPRTARFSQAVDTPPAAEAETSSVAAAVAAEPAEEAATEPPVAAAAQDAGATEEPDGES